MDSTRSLAVPSLPVASLADSIGRREVGDEWMDQVRRGLAAARANFLIATSCLERLRKRIETSQAASEKAPGPQPSAAPPHARRVFSDPTFKW